MKEKLRRGIGILLIIVGVTIMLVIGYQKYETSQKQKELKNILEEIINTEKSRKIIEGFEQNKFIHKLCKTCGFASKF